MPLLVISFTSTINFVLLHFYQAPLQPLRSLYPADDSFGERPDLDGAPLDVDGAPLKAPDFDGVPVRSVDIDGVPLTSADIDGVPFSRDSLDGTQSEWLLVLQYQPFDFVATN